jgi:tetratricopeptide (TPR) repeat protein
LVQTACERAGKEHSSRRVFRPRGSGGSEHQVSLFADARAAGSLGGVAYFRGDFDRAASLSEVEGRLLRSAGAHAELSRVLLNYASVERRRGRLAQARALVDEALASARRFGDRGAEAVIDLQRGFVLCDLGETEQARAAFERAERFVRALSDRRSLSTALLGRARLEATVDSARARAALEEARELTDGESASGELGSLLSEVAALVR